MSIAEKGINFKEIEEKIYREVCALGCARLKEILERIDIKIKEDREKSRYRHKGYRKTVLKTIMGEVEYVRSIYESTDESGIKKYVYLLDEEIGIKGNGFFSGLLSEYIVKASCESSYRNAAETVTNLTGQRISHTAAWKVVQTVGEKVNKQEHLQARNALKHLGKGKIESPVLFEEQDGIWLKLQGKARKQYGESKEMKLAIAYDGAEKNGKRYRLTNKVACANFESAERFIRRKEGVIANTYCTDEIEMRFLNGDGAEWIRNGIREENVHFQLDPYHRNKAIISYVHDTEKRKVLFELLYSKKTEDLMNCIEAYINISEDIEEQKGLNKLYVYFSSNKDSLTEIHRRGLDIPDAPKGKEYRHLGCMESNIFSIIGNRMKGRRACWSIKGGNNMARMLCLKMTGRLSEVSGSFTAITLPEKYSEELNLPLSSAQVPQSTGKGYNGFKSVTSFPATAEYKWLRKLGCIGFEA